MGQKPGIGVAAPGLISGDTANAIVTGSFGAVGASQPLGFVGWFDVSIWASFKTTLTTTAGSTAATVASAGTLAAGAAINGANVPKGTTVGAISGTSVTLAPPTITLQGRVDNDGMISFLVETANLLGATVSGAGIPSGATVASIVTPAVQNPSYPGGVNTRGRVLLSNTATTAQIAKDPINISFALTGNGVLGGADANAVFTGAGVTWTGGTIQLEKSFDGGATFIVASRDTSGSMAQWNGGTPIATSFMEPERDVLYRLNCPAYTSASGVTINYRISTSGAAGQTMSYGGNV